MKIRGVLAAALVMAALLGMGGARALAQPIDMSHGGPVDITASDGIDWHQNDQTIIARGDARAVRGNVTVTADRLIAYYRKKAGAAGTQAGNTPQGAPAPAPARQAAAPALASDGTDTGGNEIYRLEAIGNVHIFTQTDRAEGDHGVYDIDQAVLVLTGKHLKVTTPKDVLTARDVMEYWSQRHMAVARGDAVATSDDGRRITADTLVAYLTNTDQNQNGASPNAASQKPQKQANADQDPLAQSGKIERVEAFGHVDIRTQTQTVTGDRGVYVPDTGIARLAGNTHLTQGQNQVNGQGLEVNLKTGIYRLISAPGQRVQGLVMPNDNSTRQGSGTAPTAPPSTAAPAQAR